MATIEVGSRFSSYEELERTISEFEKETKMSFWKREAKTLENVLKKNPKLDRVPPQLKYYMLKYACIAGGRIHNKRFTDGSRQSK